MNVHYVLFERNQLASIASCRFDNYVTDLSFYIQPRLLIVDRKLQCFFDALTKANESIHLLLISDMTGRL